jgi:hypothetical protein
LPSALASLLPPARRAPPPYRPPNLSSSAAAVAAAQPPAPEADALASRLARLLPPPAAEAAAAGLSNAAGEYNCFLNAIVQALFHVRCFREHLATAKVPPAGDAPLAVARGKALVSALQQLFAALSDGAALQRDAADVGPAAAQHAVAPTALRMTLAALSTHGGEGAMYAMADAAEVLGVMFEAFATVSAFHYPQLSVAESPVASMFGIGIREYVHCSRCRLDTHSLQYRTFFHIASRRVRKRRCVLRVAFERQRAELRFLRARSTELRVAHGIGAASSFEELLSQLQHGTKGCDTDRGGCGLPAPVTHALDALPSVYTLSLVWDTAQASEADVAATLQARLVLRLCCAWVLTLCAGCLTRHAPAGAEHHAAPGAAVRQRRRGRGRVRAARRHLLLRQPLRVVCAHRRAQRLRLYALLAGVDALRRRGRHGAGQLGGGVRRVRQGTPAADRALLRARVSRALRCASRCA